MSKKIVAMLLSVFMLLACLAGCADQAEGQSDVGGDTAGLGTIKIGGIGPLTGGAAMYGNAAKQGAEIAIEEINALGGIQFVMNFQDDEHDAEKSVNAYNNLKDWGMQILCGTVTTAPCVAVSAESNADRIFTLTPSASSTDVIGGQPDTDGNVTIARKDNVFQMCFTDPNQGIASAQYISEQKLGEKIAVIYNNADPYSTGIYQKFAAQAQTLGLNVVSVTTFSSDDNADFTVQLTEAKNAGADLVFLPIYCTPASMIFTQAAAMEYAPTFFGVDGMDGILGIKNFDTSLAEGVMLLTPFAADAEDDLTKSFVAKYEEKYKETPNQFAADGYDCIYALYAACVKAGVSEDMDAAAICDKLIEVFSSEDFSVDGLTGEGMTWSGSGEVSKAPKGMVIRDGVYVGM